MHFVEWLMFLRGYYQCDWKKKTSEGMDGTEYYKISIFPQARSWEKTQ